MTIPKKIAGGLIVAGVGLMTLAEVSRAEVASWYGAELSGSPMANGQPFDPNALTAAHKTLPLGSRVLVSRGGKEVEVTITDRGPFTPGRDIDLSRAAARELGISGLGAVQVEPISGKSTTKPEPPKLQELPKTGGPGG